MSFIHTVIVPGVGGSDTQHWQTWLQKQLPYSSRVQQQDWHLPILSKWVASLVSHIKQISEPIQIIAHSFGCLTTIAALNQYPELRKHIRSILLVAPANPARFSQHGFALAHENLSPLFMHYQLDLPALMVVSENDPWLSYDDAIHYAAYWKTPYINQGMAGHINVASGFGPWPQVWEYIQQLHCQTTDSSHTTALQTITKHASLLAIASNRLDKEYLCHAHLV